VIGMLSLSLLKLISFLLCDLQAMKVVNTMKLKEEVDYEILYKKMEREVDQLTSEMERQQKVIRSEKMQMDKRLKESERSFHDLRMTSNMQIEVSFMVHCFVYEMQI
jgi:kinesin family protein 5